MPEPIPAKTRATPSTEGAPENPIVMRSRLIRDIKAGWHFRVDPTGELWRWDQGTWMISKESWTWEECSRQLCGWALQGYLTAPFVSCVHGNLKTHQDLLEIKPPLGLINLLNGLMDPRTMRIIPTTPQNWPSPIQIPIEYKPGATCPAWDKFLGEVLPTDVVDFAWQLIGSCMVADSFDQKAIWLSGEGGNGKGTLILAIDQLVGEANTVALSFKEMTEDRFALAQLYGKILVTDGDSSLNQIKESSVFKRVSAHDKFNAQKKYGQPFDFRSFAKIIIGANGLPNSTDLSTGFLDRPQIVPMNAKLRGTTRERRQEEILGELRGEASGALNRALEALGRVFAKGGYTVPASIQEATAEYRTEAHPMYGFFAERLVLDEAGEIALPDLRDAQVAWSRMNDQKALTNYEITKWLLKAYPEIRMHRQDRANNKGSWIVGGLRLV